jgi:hypothetical protein
MDQNVQKAANDRAEGKKENIADKFGQTRYRLKRSKKNIHQKEIGILRFDLERPDEKRCVRLYINGFGEKEKEKFV